MDGCKILHMKPRNKQSESNESIKNISIIIKEEGMLSQSAYLTPHKLITACDQNS